MKDAIRRSGALVALVVTIAVLHAMSRFGLRGPTGLSSAELSAWVDDPTEAIATTLRWLALFLAYYLGAVVLAIMVFGERLEKSPLGRLVPSWVAGTAGVLLGVSAVGVPLAVHMTSVDGLSEVATPVATALTLQHLDDPLTLDPLPDSNADPEMPTAVDSATEHSPDRDSLWRASSGDSLWSIAEDTLLDDPRRTEVSEQEVAEYWRVLIEANTDRLVEPGNPDLILPGQEFILPPTS